MYQYMKLKQIFQMAILFDAKLVYGKISIINMKRAILNRKKRWNISHVNEMSYIDEIASYC